MKKLWIVFILIFTLTASCFTGCMSNEPKTEGGALADEALLAEAAAVFTLDVNPGIRVYVKDDDTVLAVEATNEDGETVVAELDVEGMDYESAIEAIVDTMNEEGFIEAETNSVLISVEKKTEEISERINDKIGKSFEKHGKKAAVIEQELEELGEEIEKAVGDMAEKYNISKGKAHLIEKIREECPELSEEELAKLKVNDLGLLLDNASEDIKEKFKRFDKPAENMYVGREVALEKALQSLNVTEADVSKYFVRMDRDEGKMVYSVQFIYNELIYEIIVDAKSGEIVSTESKEYKEFDVKGKINEFCNKNNIELNKFKEQIKDRFAENIGELFGKKDHDEEDSDAPISKGEALRKVIKELNIEERKLKKTEAELVEVEDGTAFCITVELDNGDVYKIVLEAYTGVVVSAELNGEAIE